MKIKYIIQIILTTVLGPHKIMVARGFTKKQWCVWFFSFFFILTYYKSEGCWGGIMEVVAWFMANIFIKIFQSWPPFTTSQSILDYCGNKSVLRAIFPVLLKDRKVKIQLGNMVKSEYF